MATFVLVHGANAGGWIWQAVPALLRAEGHHVFTPTLTGLGERSHLLRPDIDLALHIQDIVNVLHYEDLQRCSLVGHGYGGMIITGVAEQVPEQLAQLIYLDGLFPENGQALVDLYDPENFAAMLQARQTTADSWLHPPQEPEIDPRLTDHPAKTFFQPLSLSNPMAKVLPRTYILCTEKAEMGPEGEGILKCAGRARAAEWGYMELKSGHYPMWNTPERLVSVLLKLVQP